MSRQTDILAALRALAQATFPAADIAIVAPGDGLPAPDRISPGGRIIIEYGDPGDPAIDLSPVTYNYEHQIPMTFAASQAVSGDSALVQVAAMLTAFGAAIAANRQLGGLVDYLDAAAPSIDELYVPGGTPTREAPAMLTAIYATSTPL